MGILVDLEGSYDRWRWGWCPCCGGSIEEYEATDGTITQPQAIGEQVRLCGRCIAMRHHEFPENFVEKMLEAILRKI